MRKSFKVFLSLAVSLAMFVTSVPAWSADESAEAAAETVFGDAGETEEG